MLGKSNFRFNPTVNGRLHIGHFFMALVNRDEASACGGKFIVRFDDNQPEWLYKNKFSNSVLKGWMKEDFEWMGIVPDLYTSQAEVAGELENDLDIQFRNRDASGAMLRGRFYYDQVPFTGEEFTYYPYAPWYTLEKVWLDWKDGVRLLIRGRDLITEFSMYNYFVDLLGLTRVDQVFLPRLRYKGKDGLGEVSKTAGNLQVATLREKGWKAEDVMSLLRVSVLKDSEKEFRIENIKTDPVIEESVIAEMESRIQGTARVSSSGSSTVTFVFPPR